MGKGAFKYYISTFGGVQNLGKPAYVILARSLNTNGEGMFKIEHVYKCFNCL